VERRLTSRSIVCALVVAIDFATDLRSGALQHPTARFVTGQAVGFPMRHDQEIAFNAIEGLHLFGIGGRSYLRILI
jgi:hypothetical protein